jgi:hypothetical protein
MGKRKCLTVTDAEVVEKWNDKVFQSLLAMNDDMEENMDGLAAAANWFVANRHQFTDANADTFVDNLSKNVTREVQNHSLGHDDPERIGGDLAAVQEIAKTLNLDFREEEEWLNEAISESGKKDGGDDGDSWRDHSDGGHRASIEAIFDALLE